AFQGVLSPVSAADLSATATSACIEATGIDAANIDEAIIGCVLSAGTGQAPARQAALAAGLPDNVGCMTINKVCGSGMKAAMLAHDLIRAGSAKIVLAGGMESMSNAPYLLPKARSGYRMGHQEIIDHMFFDGLQDAYSGNMMGLYAEQTANRYAFSREEQDAFAIESVKRAIAATENGAFTNELAPVTFTHRRKQTTVDTDEEPLRANIERIPTLRPAFSKDGTVTAATSSTIADGAASLLLMSQSNAEQRGLEPLARIAGHAGHAHEPEWFTTAPVSAIKKLHEQTGWSPDNVDLYEINEAFACVTMAAMTDIGIDHIKVNVHGGACALGHPLGASGARITTTLIHALRNRGGRRGIAALCIGGGEAVAIALEID
ncbi:MAG: acetyl-CoA C-acyltransferase, partial [Gammaproteobacteria bacterium]|nr:acetyl-CoA C-acyltransferase [Gammaproteobacteria bacterium]